jgi:hypothetical protein
MHAQTLPATPPTSSPAQTPAAPGATTPGAATPGTATPPPSPPQRAEVTYSNGQLQVRADNSSLNQILRTISHTTGLKITGGVEEQRVFGSYGPGPISSVLATLLDGTTTNVMLLGGNPPELQLTQRNGGAEPPSPTSEAYAMYDDGNDHNTPVPPPASHNPSAPVQPQGSATAAPAAHPPTVPTTPAPAATLTTTPTTPATAAKPLTPEMVEQQLLKMQTQQNVRKQQLDEQIRQQQIEQNKKLKPQSQPTQPNPPTTLPTPQNATPSTPHP